jgi:hypothetical protein
MFFAAGFTLFRMFFAASFVLLTLFFLKKLCAIPNYIISYITKLGDIDRNDISGGAYDIR